MYFFFRVSHIQWSIPEDIAGSTILAVGASMPLLLINSFAKVEESDVGTAAIIGSVVCMTFSYFLSFLPFLCTLKTPISSFPCQLFTITIGFSVICMVCGENDRIPSPSFSRDSTVLIILLGLLILFTSDKSISLAVSFFPIWFCVSLFFITTST